MGFSPCPGLFLGIFLNVGTSAWVMGACRAVRKQPFWAFLSFGGGDHPSDCCGNPQSHAGALAPGNKACERPALSSSPTERSLAQVAEGDLEVDAFTTCLLMWAGQSSQWEQTGALLRRCPSCCFQGSLRQQGPWHN